MAFYQQNEANEWPRNGTAPVKDFYPLAYPVYAPQLIAPSQENPSSTSSYGGYRAVPLQVDVQPSFGDHDGLHGRLMAVSQADTYNSEPNPWPAAGVYDVPNGQIAVMEMMRLQPTTSAHPGLSTPASGGGPTMVFRAPPVFSAQSRPIYALGL